MFLSFTFNYDFGTLDANNNYSCNALRIINIVCVFLRSCLVSGESKSSYENIRDLHLSYWCHSDHTWLHCLLLYWM